MTARKTETETEAFDTDTDIGAFYGCFWMLLFSAAIWLALYLVIDWTFV